ncbi:hypothetical protein BGK67_02825 [Streptomyces subrutilus]|uniref:Uncharacterized protein n=1 Tax=Streptomyces subrutilus TaxID=36818 RepID=A0A1E5PLJ4_9ACTN|nr:hypothetical protein BGK67_02825 [Streptomyces subrutilus]
MVSVSLQNGGVPRAESAGQRYVLGTDDLCVFHELTSRVYGWSGYADSRPPPSTWSTWYAVSRRQLHVVLGRAGIRARVRRTGGPRPVGAAAGLGAAQPLPVRSRPGSGRAVWA